jgi:hypothetical protein
MRIPLGGLGLGAAILSGCGVRREPTAHGRTVVRVWSMWTGDEEKVFQGVVDYYNRAQDKVYLQNLGSVPDDKILRAITAGAPPDFFTLREPGYLAPLAANDALLPLDDWFRAAELPRGGFRAGRAGAGTLQGQTLLDALPAGCDGAVLQPRPLQTRGSSRQTARPKRWSRCWTTRVG